MPKNRISRRVPPIELCGIRFSQTERRSLYALARSRDVRDRRLCLEYLWCGAGVYHNRRFIFDIANYLIPDRSQRVRWGMLLLLGDHYAESHPKQLWPLVAKWGSVGNEDIRAGVACCILENILEYHFCRYFCVAKRLIEKGNRRFGLTLTYCWKLGQAAKPRNAHALDAFLHTLTDAKTDKARYDRRTKARRRR